MKGAGVLVAVALLAAGLAGCVDEEGFSFGVDPERIRCADATSVDNRMGQFEYGGAASCKTESERYDWSNPMTRARLSWGGTAASGSVSGAILDSLDRVVYEFSVDSTGAGGASGESDLGMPGPSGQTWSIELEFRNFTGTMGLSMESTL